MCTSDNIFVKFYWDFASETKNMNQSPKIEIKT